MESKKTIGSKYYVVVSGRKLGIYQSWHECKESVNGYSGSNYKGYEILDEAMSHIKDNNLDVGSKERVEEQLSLNNFAGVMGDEDDDSDAEKSKETSEKSKDKTAKGNCVSNKATEKKAQEKNKRGKVTEEENGAESNSCPFCDHNNGDSDCMIQCDTCKMWVHYVCTNLPEYQLLAFISTSRKFEYAKCISENIPSKKIKISVGKNEQNSYEEIKKKESEIKSLKNILSKTDESEKLRHQYEEQGKQLESEQQINRSLVEQREKENTAKEMPLKEKDIGFKLKEYEKKLEEMEKILRNKEKTLSDTNEEYERIKVQMTQERNEHKAIKE